MEISRIRVSLEDLDFCLMELQSEGTPAIGVAPVDNDPEMVEVTYISNDTGEVKRTSNLCAKLTD